MNSQLNPNAAVFIPVSPTKLLMMDDAIITASPGIKFEEPIIEYSSGPKHVDYFMRDNFSTLPNKMTTPSACSVSDFTRDPQEHMEHISIDQLLGIQNLTRKDVSTEFCDQSDNSIENSSERSFIHNNTVNTVSDDSNESKNLVSTITTKLKVEVSCFKITEESQNSPNNVIDKVSEEKDSVRDKSMSFETVSSKDGSMKGSTSPKKKPRSKYRNKRRAKKFERSEPSGSDEQSELSGPAEPSELSGQAELSVPAELSGQAELSGPVESSELSEPAQPFGQAETSEPSVIETDNNEGYVTEHRRTPPIDLTFKPIQTFGDVNPFGALQTPITTTPTDQCYGLAELYKTPQETPEKGTSCKSNVTHLDLVINIPPSFILKRSTENDSLIPFEELESPNELPPFVHPPNPNRIISSTELPKSLEIEDGNNTLLTENVAPSEIKTDDKKDGSIESNTAVKSMTTTNTEKIESASESPLVKIMSTIDLNMTESFLRPEYTISQSLKESEKMYNSNKDSKSLNQEVLAEDNTISDKPTDKEDTQILSSLNDNMNTQESSGFDILSNSNRDETKTVAGHEINVNHIVLDIFDEEPGTGMEETSFTSENCQVNQEMDSDSVQEQEMETETENNHSVKEFDHISDQCHDFIVEDHELKIESNCSITYLEETIQAQTEYDGIDSELKEKTKEMTLDLKAQSITSQSTPEDLKNLVQGFEVINKDELIQENCFLAEEASDVSEHALQIENVRKNLSPVCSLHDESLLSVLEMDDVFTVEKTPIIVTVPAEDGQTSNHTTKPPPTPPPFPDFLCPFNKLNSVENVELVSSLVEGGQRINKTTTEEEKKIISKICNNTERDQSDTVQIVTETETLTDSPGEVTSVPVTETTEVSPTSGTLSSTPAALELKKDLQNSSATEEGADLKDKNAESQMTKEGNTAELRKPIDEVTNKNTEMTSKPAAKPNPTTSSTKQTAKTPVSATRPTSGTKSSSNVGKSTTVKPPPNNTTSAKPTASTSSSTKPTTSTASTSKPVTGVAISKPVSTAVNTKPAASSASATPSKPIAPGAGSAKSSVSNASISKTSTSTSTPLKTSTNSTVSSKSSGSSVAPSKPVASSPGAPKSAASSPATPKPTASSVASLKSATTSTAPSKPAASNGGPSKPTASSVAPSKPAASSGAQSKPAVANSKPVASSSTSTKSAVSSSASTKSTAAATTAKKPAVTSTPKPTGTKTTTPSNKPAVTSTTPSKTVPKQLSVGETTLIVKSLSKPTTPTSNPTTPTSPQSPMAKLSSFKTPPRPEMKSPSSAKLSSPPKSPTSLEKKTTGDLKSQVKKTEAPKGSGTTPVKSSITTKPATPGVKATGPATKSQTPTAAKTPVEKSTATASKKPGVSDDTANASGPTGVKKPATSISAKTAEKVSKESATAKSAVSGKTVINKTATGGKTDSKVNTKIAEKPVSSKKAEEGKKDEKTVQVQEHKVSTTNDQPLVHIATEVV